MLTREEREKFARWAFERAKDNGEVVEQMKRIGVPAAVIEQLASEHAALLFVGRLLLSSHDDT